jgi:serine/threonine protein phosphatase PrpC
MKSAQQACEALLQDALDGGGTDNITVVVGRAVPASSIDVMDTSETPAIESTAEEVSR